MWVRLPAISHDLVSNILGVLGLLGIVVAVGGLTGNWLWSLLTASLMLVAVSYTSYAAARPARSAPAARSGPARPVKAA